MLITAAAAPSRRQALLFGAAASLVMVTPALATPEEKPSWRGWIHTGTFPLAIVLGGILIAVANGTTARVGAAIFAIAEPVKSSTPEALAALKADGIRVVMLTGDNWTTARAVARQLGIDNVEAEVLPDEKSAVVQRYKAEGRVVAMAGDGINDAPALAEAAVGIAMGTGTDVAIEASDLTLARGDLRAAADAIRLSRRTLGTIKGNLFWAFAYNVAALPIAAAGLLNPMLAGAAMAFSSVFVVSNSLRLRSFKPLASDRADGGPAVDRRQETGQSVGAGV